MLETTENRNVEIMLDNVGMTYDAADGKKVQALTNVTMDIHKGEFISLLGPSGCGKTTLLRIIAELYDWRTVIKNVELPLEITHESKSERRQRAIKMLDLVGLSEFADHYPRQLSGGMQQRVGIARALMLQPEILLMDEPFSALDEFTREKLHVDLLKIWRKTNKTIIFVTHNISESVFLSDKVCVLSPHPGRLSAVIDIDLPRPRHMEIRDTPEFTALVSKVRNSFEGV